MPPATKAMIQLLGGLLSKIVQLLPAAKREKIEKVINDIDEGVIASTIPERRTESVRRQANKKANPTNTKHYSGYKNPLILTAAEKRRTEEFKWTKVTKGTK